MKTLHRSYLQAGLGPQQLTGPAEDHSASTQRSAEEPNSRYDSGGGQREREAEAGGLTGRDLRGALLARSRTLALRMSPLVT